MVRFQGVNDRWSGLVCSPVVLTQNQVCFLLEICSYCRLAISSFSIHQRRASDLGGDLRWKTASIRDFEGDSIFVLQIEDAVRLPRRCSNQTQGCIGGGGRGAFAPPRNTTVPPRIIALYSIILLLHTSTIDTN